MSSGNTGEIATCPHQDTRCPTQGIGWVYRYGPIVLITCCSQLCSPRRPGWLVGVRFV